VDLELSGRVAIVTGAGRGIGLAVAERLVAEGADVVGVSRTPPEHELPGLVHVQADLLDEPTPAALVEGALARFGRLDVLVNNAGAGRLRSGYDGVSAADWEDTWRLLFLAQVRMSEAALPHLLAAGGGVIVNMSSRNARVPVRGVPDYSAAKAALTNYSKGLAQQFAKQGLRVVTVSPGPVATPLWLGPDGVAAQEVAMEGGDANEIVRQTEQAIPLGRFVTAEEVADLVAFLASPRAAMITGTDVLIDGGLSQAM